MVRMLEGDRVDKPIQPEREAIERARRDNEELDRRRFEDSKRYYLENKHKYEM